MASDTAMADPRRAPALFVSQYYRPEPIGSGPYIGDMAEYLCGAGMPVAVLTARPSYPQGAVPADYESGRRDRETVNGVEVYRTRPARPAGRGVFGRALAEGMFLLRGAMALLIGMPSRSPQVVSVCPSTFAVVLGIWACRRGGRHVVVVHDIQSGLAAGLGMVARGGAMRWLQRLERWAFNRVDHILVLSAPMRDHLRRIGVVTPIDVLPIWIDTQAVAPLPPRPGNHVTAMYSGNLGRKQALDQLLDMAALLQARDAPVRLLIRGDGSEAERLRTAAAARALGNVTFEPLVPADRLAEGLAEGDIHLVPQHPAIADFAVPSKVYAIMAAGRPFVAAAAPGSLLWELRDEADGFACVPANDPEALADAVQRLAEDVAERARLGRNARAYAVRLHDRRLVLDRFLAILAA